MDDQMDIYECTNISNDVEAHILSEPIALSCGHCVCKGCIREQIYCNRCKLTNTNDLVNSKVSLGMLELLKLNREVIFKSQKVVLEKKLLSLREIHDSFKNHIQNIKDEVEIRIESIKLELDNLKQEFYSEIDEEFEIFKMKIEEKKFNEFEIEIEKNKSEPERRDKLMKGLNELFKKFQDYKPKISIELSDIKIVRNLIGEVKYELRKSETNYKRCFLSFDQHMVVTHVKNEINELIDEKLLVIANYTDSCLVTKSFELTNNPTHLPELKSENIVDKIGDETFKPFGITTNKKDKIYITDWLNNRILVTDLRLKLLKIVNTCEFNRPCGIEYHERLGVIFVCDSENFCLKNIDTENYECKKVNNLAYKPHYLVSNDEFISIQNIDTYSIFVYQIDNFELKKKIETNYLSAMFFPVSDNLMIYPQALEIINYDAENNKLSKGKLAFLNHLENR